MLSPVRMGLYIHLVPHVSVLSLCEGCMEVVGIWCEDLCGGRVKVEASLRGICVYFM